MVVSVEMPVGRFPFRRTFEFLSSGNLVLKSNVKTVLINYTHCKESLGLRNFIYKDIPQIQFKNQGVQIMTTRNKSNIPVVNVFFGDRRKVMIDVEGKTGPEILEIFGKVAGATEREKEDRAMPKYPGRHNPANFGKYGHCYCICEKPGQAPCPSRVPHPDAKKPKWWQQRGEAAQ